MAHRQRLVMSCAALAATAAVLALGAYLFTLGWNWMNTADVKPSAIAFFAFVMGACAVSAICVATMTHKAIKAT